MPSEEDMHHPEIPDCTRFVTEISGAIVHGDKPMSAEERAAMEKIIEAAKKRMTQLMEDALLKSVTVEPKIKAPDCGCRGVVHTCNTIT